MATRAQTRSALRDLAKKLRLEKVLAKEMRTFFRKIAKKSRSHYIIFGTVLNAFEFQSELKEILAKHYRRVFREFRDPDTIIAKSIFYDQTKQQGEIDKRIKEEQNKDIAERSEVQSKEITATNQRQLDATFAAALSAAVVAAQESIAQGVTGVSISNEDIAQSAARAFNTRATGRSGNIGLTETQAAAENAKGITINARLQTTSEVAIKTWVTIGDAKVRPAHVGADNQRQAVSDPFIVGGELLMHPGDASLGASIGNVANCRCSAVYTV